MTVSLIVAMTDERVIGLNNQLPWHISEDLKRFKKITMGHPIIMGRKTFDSIGRALPGRKNIVVSRNPGFTAAGVDVVASVEEAIQRGTGISDEVFIIGGSHLFEASLPLADKVYMTLIHKKYKGDVFFPAVDFVKELKIIERSEHEAIGPDPFSYSFITAEIKRKT